VVGKQIDDRKPAMTEPYAGMSMLAHIIRAPVRDRLGHAIQRLA
jgi:hypothetical protein